MKTIKILLCVLFASAVCAFVPSCNEKKMDSQEKQESWEEIWVVASRTIWCGADELYGEHYLIKRNGDEGWTVLSANVVGFDYEEGYEYVIVVKAVPMQGEIPQDASSICYTLIKIISKEQKDSDISFVLTNDKALCKAISEPVCGYNGEGEWYSITDGIMKIDSLYVFLGDILLKQWQVDAFNKTKSGCIANRARYWPNNVIYYTFDDGFIYQKNVESAISEWENKTSLSFIKGTGVGDYIEFFHGDGNYSYLGKIGGKQQISLMLGGSDVGSAIHEIGHAAGLYHEQCRTDRDTYITVYPENIESGKEHNFEIYADGVDIGVFVLA